MSTLDVVARITRKVAFRAMLVQIIGPLAGLGLVLILMKTSAPSEITGMAVFVLFGMGFGCLPGALLLGLTCLAEEVLVESQPCRGLTASMLQVLLTGVTALAVSLPILTLMMWLLADGS